jgi:hypothetical protein
LFFFKKEFGSLFADNHHHLVMLVPFIKQFFFFFEKSTSIHSTRNMATSSFSVAKEKSTSSGLLGASDKLT